MGRTCSVLVSFAVVLAGCLGDDGEGGGGGPAGFCSRLGAASTCEGAQTTCEEVLTIDEAADASCVAARDEFLGCLAGEALVCASSSLVYAGENAATGSSYSLGSYTVQTSGACVARGDAWQRCLYCREALPAARAGAESMYVDDSGDPTCDTEREAFLGCAIGPEAICAGTVEIHSGGTPESGERFDLGSVTVWTSAACAERGRAWQGCALCGHGLGYGKSGKDVGQRCGGADECAEGLTCALGHCTAPCGGEDRDPCTGRRFVDGQCRNDDGLETACSGIVGACTVSCDGNDDCTAIRPDGFCPGNGAILQPVDGFVEYGACFFGPCGEGFDGCTATPPFP